MPTLNVTLPPLHRGQMRIVRHPARFKVVACGRRFGKTRLGVAGGFETALQGDPAIWVAPTYKLAAEGWNLANHLVEQMPGAVTHKGDQRIEFPGGGIFQVHTASDPDGLRGKGWKRAILDEAAYMLQAAWTQALRPALSDMRGDAWFLSSPAGRNWFYHLYLRGQNADEPDYASWNMPTTANPYIDPAEVEQARGDMPDRWFRQEYLAEFLDDSGGVFRAVRQGVDISPRSRTSSAVFVGVDLGRTNDATVLTAIQGGHVVEQDAFTGIGWELQFGRLEAFCARHSPASVLIETNFNDMFTERARSLLPWRVEGFRTTEQSKRDAIDNLALGIERVEVTYPEIPELINELEAFEYTAGPSGKLRMGAPSGFHDDRVLSLALARWAETSIPVAGSFSDFRDVRVPASLFRR